MRVDELNGGFTGPIALDLPELLPQADGTVLGTTWVATTSYSPTSNAWTTLAAPPLTGTWSYCGELPDGRVLRAASLAPGSTATSLFNPVSNVWSAGGNLAFARNGPSCGVLADGRAVLTGGVQSQNQFVAELFDPSTNTWSVLANKPSLGHVSTPALRLQDGRLFFFDSPEIFDPATMSFRVVGSIGQSYATGTLLKDGRVLLLNTGKGEIFDPVTGMYTLVAPAPTARSGFSATLMSDGRVLVSGGHVGGSTTVATVEVYDPLANQWSMLAPLLHQRGDHGSALVAPGLVLVAGGREYIGGALYPIPSAQNGEVLDVGCSPISCGSPGAQCGAASDGCGTPLSCGDCGGALQCRNNQCMTCQPATCTSLGFTCGDATDGCGAALSCGTCRPDLTCVNHRCGPSVTAQAAVHDSTLGAPRCALVASSCDTGSLVTGRGAIGPELHAPNTLGGTCADGYYGSSTYNGERIDRLALSTLDGKALVPGSRVRLDATVWAFAPGDVLEVYATANPSSPTWTLMASATASALYTASVLSPTFILPATTDASGNQAIRAQLRSSGTSTGPCDTGLYDDRDDLVVLARLPDTTGPVVSFYAPTWRATVRGAYSAYIAAQDPSGVSSVKVFDGAALITSLVGSGSFTWDTRLTLQGEHQLTAVATDVAGNVTTTPILVVTVDNAPIVSLTAPTAGSALTGSVSLSATASAVTGRSITVVDFLVDGVLVGTAGASPYLSSWNSAAVANGPHTLVARATDSAGLVRTSAAVSATARNDSTPPTLVVDSPVAGAVVRGSASIAVSASDASGVAQVQIFDGATLLATLATAPYVFSWDATAASDGAHTLHVTALDSVGNLAALEVPVTVDNTPPTVTVAAPAAGTLLRASVPITVTTSDVSGVASVQLFDGATLLATLTTGPYEFSWDTTSSADGAHGLRVAVLDAAGNLASVEVPVTVDNTLPAVALGSPASGTFGAGAMTLTATASDASGVVQVSFFDSGSLLGASTTAPYSLLWTATVGTHSLTASATDAAGNVRTSAPVAVTIVTSQTAVYSTTYKAPLCATRSTACSTGTLLAGRGTLGPEGNRPNTINGSCADGNSGNYHATGESNDAITVESVSGGPLAPGVSVRVNAAIWAVNTSDRVDIWSAPLASSPVWTLRQTLKPTVYGAASVVSTTFALPAGTTQAVRVSLRRAGSATACPSGSYNDHDDLVFATN